LTPFAKSIIDSRQLQPRIVCFIAFSAITRIL